MLKKQHWTLKDERNLVTFVEDNFLVPGKGITPPPRALKYIVYSCTRGWLIIETRRRTGGVRQKMYALQGAPMPYGIDCY